MVPPRVLYENEDKMPLVAQTGRDRRCGPKQL